MSEELGALYLRSAPDQFRTYKELAETTQAQISSQEWFFTPDLASNSIAVIIKHVRGNLRSRWTDFLSSDGEKPDRNRSYVLRKTLKACPMSYAPALPRATGR
jgi:hypothetical protein